MGSITINGGWITIDDERPESRHVDLGRYCEYCQDMYEVHTVPTEMNPATKKRIVPRHSCWRPELEMVAGC